MDRLKADEEPSEQSQQSDLHSSMDRLKVPICL